MDPRLNCGAGICCGGRDALETTAEILCDMGLSEEQAKVLAGKMKEKKLWLAPIELAEVIRAITYDSDKKE